MSEYTVEREDSFEKVEADSVSFEGSGVQFYKETKVVTSGPDNELIVAYNDWLEVSGSED